MLEKEVSLLVEGLIYSVLSLLPTYTMSLFPLPASVAHKFEKMQKDFLWKEKTRRT